MQRIITVIVVLWLVIGVAACAQRGYFTGDHHCSNVSDSLLTVISGPLNYVGVNPRVTCTTPQPSK